MIASPRPFVPSTQPSRTVIRAAHNAASSQHAQINLVRLIKSLDKLDPTTDERDLTTRRKDWENVQYARVLLDTLQQGNEGSSTTLAVMTDLNRTLKGVEMRFRHAASVASPIAITAPAAAVPLPESPALNSSSTLDTPSESGIPAVADKADPPLAPSAVLRKRHLNVENYLRSRLTEDREGDEAGLLPLKVSIRKEQKEQNGRDSLLGDSRPGMGSAQLHEELGGQLADMSHRLKLNAVHFANSLEDEKSLLDTSTDVLEKNLSATRTSKKNLSTVSSKGRGTTCITLGIVLLVLIIFVWTYMLIRFT